MNKKWAYYNECDPGVAEWLRQLIKLNQIAPGEVDERSIEDVAPIEVKSFAQCHWFAGIGTWSYSLRQAGWPDDKPVWTGSCPCQPFSEAGQRKGFDDERHLWPDWFWHISQLRPATIFGEQVGSNLEWVDLICNDLEGEGYAVGSLDLPAASVGAPHLRQRLYWVADDGCERGWRNPGTIFGKEDRSAQKRETTRRQLNKLKLNGYVGNPCEEGFQDSDNGRNPPRAETRASFERTSKSSFWAEADWLLCRDGKARPAKPGTFPLVDGPASRLVRSGDYGESSTENTAEARTLRLKGYGNAVVAPLATVFINAYSEI